MKPKFDSTKSFEVIVKPEFDPSKPFKTAIFDSVEEIKVKPISTDEVLAIVREEIRNAISKMSPQKHIIEKVTKEVPTEIKTIVKEIDKDSLNSLFKKINDLQEEIKKSEEKLRSYVISSIPIPGGPGVIGIPPPEAASESEVLTVVNKKAKWKAVSGSGGLTSGTYSVSNPTSDRTFDADNTTLDELADVVATIISDLGGL